MTPSTNGLVQTLEFIDKVQGKITGDFNAKLSREVANQLSDAGFVYNPELSFTNTGGELFDIVCNAEIAVTGDFTAKLARAITTELASEGVHKP